MKPTDLSAIESQYPHVAKGLSSYWGRPECQAYLESLVFDQRGDRQGFPPEVSAELLFFYTLVERQPGRFDIWRDADSHD